jgi:hypothetical protein
MLSGLLYGARIAIVGGYDLPDESELDQYDFVVRTNNHWIRQRGRINGLFHCCTPKLDAEKLIGEKQFKRQVEFVGCPTFAHSFKYFREFCLKTGIPMIGHSPTDSGPDNAWRLRLGNWLFKEGVGEPFTGAIAMAYFLSLPVKEVYMTGMNLYQHDPERDEGLIAHNPAVHAKLYAETAFLDSRLKLDSTLEQALEAYGQPMQLPQKQTRPPRLFVTDSQAQPAEDRESTEAAEQK